MLRQAPASTLNIRQQEGFYTENAGSLLFFVAIVIASRSTDTIAAFAGTVLKDQIAKTIFIRPLLMAMSIRRS